MKKVLMMALAALFAATTVYGGDYDISIDTTVTDDIFKDFVREAGTVTAYRGIAPGEPQGITGFDVGLEISAVDIDDAVWDQLFSDDDAPSYLPVPRLHVRKGLPFNVDVGLSYSQVPDSNIELWGGEVQWAPLEGGITMPALALRASYSTLQGVDDLDLQTYGADAVLSKGFAFLTPYAGVGVVRIEGDYAGDNATIDDNLSDHEFTEPRYFAGVQASLALLRVTADVEYMDRPVYTIKASLGW